MTQTRLEFRLNKKCEKAKRQCLMSMLDLARAMRYNGVQASNSLVLENSKLTKTFGVYKSISTTLFL